MRRIWLLSLVAALAGCGVAPIAPTSLSKRAPMVQSQSGDAPKADQSIYYPMAEDLRWIYEDGPLNSPLPMRRRSTWFLDIRRGDQGISMIGIQMRNADISGQIIHNNTGVLLAPQSGTTVGPRHYLVKYPLLIGSTWDIINTPEVVVRAKVESIESVRVHTGVYHKCFRINLLRKNAGEPEQRYATRWLAPNVGLVQQYNYDASGKVGSISRLRQFATGMAPTPGETQAVSRLFGAHHFEELDANHDDFLTAYEVSPPDLFERADLDRNGKLDRHEFFQSELYALQIKRQMQFGSREYWSFDKDLDMELNLWEASRQSWLYMPRAIREADIASVDADKNDKLNYREYQQLYLRLWGEALSQPGPKPPLPWYADDN